ncbi:predicted protein [Botrytis cinerea T4]|uniref:Uncharacterized protein n=1 Tax=Botryotinia fuckeliana (strain T4) TaxID=999810 RepID=G2YJE3_BOTF4|nr:predicted protein [Botrytis cinerea T4]
MPMTSFYAHKIELETMRESDCRRTSGRGNCRHPEKWSIGRTRRFLVLPPQVKL